jgi:hypothetical protein
MQASLSRSVIGPAGQAGGGSKQVPAEYSLRQARKVRGVGSSQIARFGAS